MSVWIASYLGLARKIDAVSAAPERWLEEGDQYRGQWWDWSPESQYKEFKERTGG